MRKILLTVLTLSLLFLIGCSDNTIETQESIQETPGVPLSLTIATLPALEAFPIFIAYDQGFFSEEGLEVHLEQFFNPRDRDVAFQTNEHIDGMVFDLVQMMIYQEAGIDLVATSSSIGMASIIGIEDVSSLEDLRGQSVLMTSNTSMDYIVDRGLASVGLSMGDITVDEVPALPTRLEMLLHGQASGAVLPDPFVSMALEEGMNQLVTTHDLGINPFVFAFRREVAQENLEALHAFYRGVNRAVDFLNTAEPELFLDMLMETVGYPEHLRDSLVLPTFPPYVVPRPEIVQDVLDFTHARGLTTQEFTIEQLVFDIGN